MNKKIKVLKLTKNEIENFCKRYKKMSCPANKSIKCPCTYPCQRLGKCCECLAYHNKSGEFPACFFSEEAEAKYDRSYKALKSDREKG